MKYDFRRVRASMSSPRDERWFSSITGRILPSTGHKSSAQSRNNKICLHDCANDNINWFNQVYSCTRKKKNP